MGVEEGEIFRFSRAHPTDEPRLQAIRCAAFAPVFASFRAILGEEVYDLAQRREDEAQGELLTTLMTPGSDWEVHTAQRDNSIVGFIALRIDRETHIGEIGLNAVDPAHTGQGIGTAMYEFAMVRMKQEGMKVATVGTGGDPSHASARRAYQMRGSIWKFPACGCAASSDAVHENRKQRSGLMTRKTYTL